MLCLSGTIEYIIRDVDGSVLESGSFKNGVTTEGLTEAANILYGATAKNTSIYTAPITYVATLALASADTASSHAGWTESTAYSESVRQTLTFGAASGGTITSSYVTITMNATADLAGAFFITNSTKGGTTGTLIATGLFNSTVATSKRSLLSGQTFQWRYIVNITGGST